MAGDTCPFPASRARVSAYLFPVVVKLTLERVEVVWSVIEIQSVRRAGDGRRLRIALPIDRRRRLRRYRVLDANGERY